MLAERPFLVVDVAHNAVSVDVLVRTLRQELRFHRLHVLFADRKFSTATGKINLVHELDPEPPRPTKKRPLLLMALSTEKSQSSQWPSRKQAGPATVTVHPESAGELEEGQIARLESELGSIEVRVAFDDRQRRDVALMEKGGWLSRGRCANVLVPARETDAGGGAAYYDTPVRLVP